MARSRSTRSVRSSSNSTTTPNQIGQIVLQFDDDAQGDPQLTHRYLWGAAVDQILADEQVTSLTTPGNILWTLADHLGTVRDLAQYDASTGDTTVASHRLYDAFGNRIAVTGAVDHLFAFTGRALDGSTGLQNNLNRWYDAELGRWVSQDPIGFAAGDANLYRYVANSPTNKIDPNGLEGNWLYNFFFGWKEGEHSKEIKQGAARRRQALIELGGSQANKELQRSLRFGGELPGDVINHTGWCALEAGVLLIPGPADDYAKNAYYGGKAIDGAVDAATAVRGFKSFRALKRALGSPGKGNVWHHIVEQCQVSKFGAKAIHNTDNVVAVPRWVNQAIADYYSSKQWFTGGKTVRQWLGSQSYEEQMRFGRDILNRILWGNSLP